MSAEQGLSTFMILLGVYNLLLHKYTRQDDIIVGVTTTGRENEVLNGVLGMFVNNLPVRCFPKETLSVRAFLEALKTTLGEAFANQAYPFDELVEKLDIKRDLNRSPLFDVVFSYMNFERADVRAGELRMSDYQAETVLSSEYDMTLYGLEAEDEIFITIKYKKALFKKESIERLAGHFTTIAALLTENIDQPIAALDILLPSEKTRLEAFNTQYEKVSDEVDAVDLLRQSFAANAVGKAILCCNQEISYQDLDEKSNRLAHYLRSELSVKPNDLVALLLERTESMVVAMLGILKSGAAYVGIDSAYPQQRVDYILDDSKARILVTEKNLLSRVERSELAIVDIEAPELLLEKAEEPRPINIADDLAYVIYTSGSTGAPKGVAITHRNLSVFLNWAILEFKNSNFDLVYATTSYCFDLSIFEVFYTLAAGKTLRILKSALEIPAWLVKDEKVLINTVPSLFAVIREDLAGLEHLSVLNLAGEQIPQTLIDSLDCNLLEVRNLYGPSEDTTYSTVYRFGNNKRKVLIGKPISNTQIHIVDTSLKPVPVGHPGEICIAGDGLAEGYLYKDELTREKFIKNPFGKGRLYKTGDLGRWTESGDIEYLGRMDRQVKIRGFRIELGEIETNIRRYPSVKNAVVVVCEKDSGKDIAAYIVADPNIDIQQLKAYLTNILPAYMIPLYFIPMEEIPLTPNGKVDVRALPEPVAVHRAQTMDTPESFNPTEEKLAKLWRAVLETDVFGKQDSFFNLGGHSLKALKLISRINRTFNIHLDLSDVFEYPTIEQFAVLMDSQKKKTSLSALKPLKKAKTYEVSHAQRRLWILNRLESKSVAYNIPMVYHIPSAIDVDALQRAFHALIEKHESLRTNFVEIEGEPRQSILDRFDFTINLRDVVVKHGLVEDSKELVQQAIAMPFDLREAPLIKVTLLRHPNQAEYILVINVHHIVLDEWSIDILARDLNLFYDHFSGRKKLTDESLLMPSPVQYKEFAHWHNRQIAEKEKTTNEHKLFWLNQFSKNAPCLDLPSDFPRPKIQTFEGRTLSFTLPEFLSQGLRKFGMEHQASEFMTLLALFHVLFSKYTGQDDIVIGTPIANREHPDIQDQIGFFLNTLALRNQSDRTENFSQFLNEVRENTLKAFSHQAYPFDMLVDGLELVRDLSRSPLFDVMLISQTPAGDKDPSLEGLQMKALEYDYPVSKFDLSISYCDEGGLIRFFFEYNKALFLPERIQNMFSHFSTLVKEVLTRPEVSMDQLSLVSPDERAALLQLSTGNDRPLSNASIVSLIERQAQENSDAMAIVFKRKKLTYKEVNDQANRMSQLLLQQGLQPGDLVAVMLDRSHWSVIAMLAIIKAGGVYMPVDPNYPPSRIDYILRDSQGKRLITSETYVHQARFDENRILRIEEIEKQLSAFPCGNPDVGISAGTDAAAYVIYTSGSTGEPKGVLGTHKCLLNLVEWQSERIEPKLRSLQFAPHSFDVSVQEMLFSLATGGTLYLIDNDTRYKMALIAEIIEKEAIEILTMPYSALNLFLNETENPTQLRSLRHLITSGEQPFINETLSRLLKIDPDLQFHNQYGPSETHVVTAYTIHGKIGEEPVKISIGRPIDNTGIYLLDKQLQPVPVGIPGDLYIGGFNVALGYIGKPELTAEKFLENPYGQGRLYKSGDLARWDFNGNLDFLGRDDGQVKVRGFRIELGEIESCLLKHPCIREAAVKLTGDGENKEIVAYFTTNVEKPDVADLKEFLAAQLPAYMIPGFYVRMDNLPRTPSGKTDLRSLPAPKDTDSVFKSEYVEPEGDTEKAIAEVWREILHREKVSVIDNFFEIGGNSIKAIQVMSRVQKLLGRKTYLNLIFQQPTIRQMAGIILDTDLRVKNMETDCILLNKECERKLFFMPPGIGYSFAYMEYARFFEDYSVYGLNFIESEQPDKSMADLLMAIQPEGPVYLFGHSAGGNMAFDVALELQARGRQIGGIVLLDSYRQMEVIDWSEEEYLNDAILYIEQNHAEFLDEEIRDAALQKIVAYRRYLNARAENKYVNCPIFQIEATDEITNFGRNISRTAWSELAPGFEVFEGFGGHMDMLGKANLERNALLTNDLVNSLFEKNVLNPVASLAKQPVEETGNA